MQVPAPLRVRRAFWTDYTHVVADYHASIWLWLVYYLIVSPTSLTMLVPRKPLLPSSFGRKRSHWRARATTPRDLAALRRPY
jgi:hypothetical protein